MTTNARPITASDTSACASLVKSCSPMKLVPPPCLLPRHQPCGPDSSCNSVGKCACNPDYNTLPDGTCTASRRVALGRSVWISAATTASRSADASMDTLGSRDRNSPLPPSFPPALPLPRPNPPLPFSPPLHTLTPPDLTNDHVPESCSIKTCGAGEECVDFGGVNGEAVCRCLEGYVGEPGSCVDLCDRMNCGTNSFCKAGICGCNDNYVISPFGNCTDFLRDECTADNCGDGNCVEKYDNWRWWNNNPPFQYCKCNYGYTPDPVSGNCIVSCPAMRCLYGYLCDTSGLYPVCKKVNCLANCPRDCVWNSQKSIQACPNTCEAINCGPLEECAMVGGVPTCKCRSGYVGQAGSCAATCNAFYCPLNQHCVEKVPGGAGTCECKAGYVTKGAYCAPTCAVYECGQNEVCEMVNLRPTCKCKPGYLGVPGLCK
ncbi:unnamed protein product, partial [Closterium sp. Naga37s-1]